MSEHLTQQWIVENKNRAVSAEDLIKQLDFTSYTYKKYDSTVFAMKMGVFNVPLVDNLSRDLHDGTHTGYEETQEFAECLGKRMALCLNYFKGKTNKEIEEALNGVVK